jgi:putative tricarboxylic transport membrane protein
MPTLPFAGLVVIVAGGVLMRVGVSTAAQEPGWRFPVVGDRAFGVLCIVLAVLFVWQATQIELGFIVDPLGPRAFPIIIGVVLALGGLYLVLRPDPSPDWPALDRFLDIGIAVAIMVGYAVLLPTLGFVLSTAVAASLLGWQLGSRPVAAAAGGIATSVGIYVVFHLILGLSLARGPWGF